MARSCSPASIAGDPERGHGVDVDVADVSLGNGRRDELVDQLPHRGGRLGVQLPARGVVHRPMAEFEADSGHVDRFFRAPLVDHIIRHRHEAIGRRVAVDPLADLRRNVLDATLEERGQQLGLRREVVVGGALADDRGLCDRRGRKPIIPAVASTSPAAVRTRSGVDCVDLLD